MANNESNPIPPGASVSVMSRIIQVALCFVLIGAITGGLGWSLARARTPDPARAVQPGNVSAMTNANGIPYVVNPEWVVERMAADDPKLVIVDLSPIAAYNQEHVPGAVHGWWQDGTDQNRPTFGQRLTDEASPDDRERWFQSLGIGPESTVVVYDNNHDRDAARMVWLLSYSGVPNATVLSGGIGAWKGALLETTSVSTTPGEGATIPVQPADEIIMTTDELARRLGDPSLVIIDGRTESERQDTLNDTILVGQIPGAIPVQWPVLMGNSGAVLRSTADLEAIFSQIGLAKGQEIVVYGRFGTESGLLWLALTSAGYTNVRIYDAGWSYWAARGDLPIEVDPDAPNIYASSARTSRIVA